MNETLKEIHLRMKDLDEIRQNNFYVVYNLRKLLKNYQNEFKKKESLEALKRIVLFLEPKGEEYDVATKEYRKLKEQMQQMCKHEIVVKNVNGDYYCPICKDYFYHSRPEDPIYSSIIYSSTQYIIELNCDINKDIAKIIDEAFLEKTDFIESIKERLTQIQSKNNFKLTRRSYEKEGIIKNNRKSN